MKECCDVLLCTAAGRFQIPIFHVDSSEKFAYKPNADTIRHKECVISLDV